MVYMMHVALYTERKLDHDGEINKFFNHPNRERDLS